MPSSSSSSKTVRKDDTTLVTLRDELKRVLKMPKPEFVEYMVKNSTKKELKELMLQFEEAELTIRPLPAGKMSVLPMLLKDKTKMELATAVYIVLQQKSCWSARSIKEFAYSISNFVVAPLFLGVAYLSRELPPVSIPMRGASMFCFISSIISFAFTIRENNTSSKVIKGLRTTFKRHVNKKLKREAAGRTYNSAWVKSLRNYFRTSKATKGASTKKAARK